MKKQRNKWQNCPICYQLIFVRGASSGKHVCPEAMTVKREIELDTIIEEETVNWTKQVEAFWDKPEVKFEQYLLEQDG